jgi:hypothetical protein
MVSAMTSAASKSSRTACAPPRPSAGVVSPTARLYAAFRRPARPSTSAAYRGPCRDHT